MYYPINTFKMDSIKRLTLTTPAHLTLNSTYSFENSTGLDGNWSTENDTDLEENHAETIIFDRVDVQAIFISLYTIVFCSCFFGNALVILVITLHWRMRSITNFCILNLACADMCVGLFCVYQNLSLYLISSWIFGNFMCKMYHFVNTLSHTASILILCVICIERYLAVIHPMKCKQLLTLNRLRLTIILVWICSAIYSSPRLYYINIVTITRDDGVHEVICTPTRTLYDSVTVDLLSMLLLFILPLVVLTVLYTRIAAALWRSSRNRMANTSNSETSSSSYREYDSQSSPGQPRPTSITYWCCWPLCSVYRLVRRPYERFRYSRSKSHRKRENSLYNKPKTHSNLNLNGFCPANHNHNHNHSHSHNHYHTHSHPYTNEQDLPLQTFNHNLQSSLGCNVCVKVNSRNGLGNNSSNTVIGYNSCPPFGSLEHQHQDPYQYQHQHKKKGRVGLAASHGCCSHPKSSVNPAVRSTSNVEPLVVVKFEKEKQSPYKRNSKKRRKNRCTILMNSHNNFTSNISNQENDTNVDSVTNINTNTNSTSACSSSSPCYVCACPCPCCEINTNTASTTVISEATQFLSGCLTRDRNFEHHHSCCSGKRGANPNSNPNPNQSHSTGDSVPESMMDCSCSMCTNSYCCMENVSLLDDDRELSSGERSSSGSGIANGIGLGSRKQDMIVVYNGGCSLLRSDKNFDGIPPCGNLDLSSNTNSVTLSLSHTVSLPLENNSCPGANVNSVNVSMTMAPVSHSHHPNHNLNHSSSHNSSGKLKRMRIIRSSKYGTKALQSRRRIIKMLVCVVFAFFFCNAPFHVRKLWQIFSNSYDGGSTFSALFTPCTFLIMYANSGISPLIYFFMSTTFRTSLRDLMVCNLRRSLKISRKTSARSTRVIPLSTAN